MTGTTRSNLDATGFVGTVLVYNLNDNSYQAAHAERIERPLIPASTFKILNSLIALETGVVADEGTVIPWDGIVSVRRELNRDLDLQTAFRLSSVAHYQELARRIGSERMQQFIDAVDYGNRDISGGTDQFWLTGGLRISPREQIDFLRRLYRGDLPFSVVTIDTVKEMMAAERTSDYAIRAKTGWAVLPEDSNVGWWVGWVERGDQVDFFATVLEASAPDETFGPTREDITRTVLVELGVLR